MRIDAQHRQCRKPQAEEHQIDLADAPLQSQQTAHNRSNNFQQTMLLDAVELQRTNPPPVNPFRVGQAK